MNVDDAGLNPFVNAGGGDVDELIFGVKDRTIVLQLVRLWMDERHAPDILQFPGDVVETALQRLEEQVSML